MKLNRVLHFWAFLWLAALGLLLQGCGGSSSPSSSPNSPTKPPPNSPTAPPTPSAVTSSSPFWTPLATDIAIPHESPDPKQECQDFLKELPAHYVKGYLTVPEDWEAPSARTVNVFYYGHLSHDARSTPILFFGGGNTKDSHEALTLLKTRIVRNDLTFIFMDQRGTGCSDSYPTDVSNETMERLTHYASASIVMDAEALRKKLFGEKSKWKVFGQSYGGLIVQRYVEIAPQSMAGAYSHDAAVDSDAVTEQVARLKSQKRLFDVYFREYPEDRQLWEKLRHKIPENLCYSDGYHRICGPATLDSALSLLGFQTQWRMLHSWISETKTEDRDYLLNNWMKAFAKNFYFKGWANGHTMAASAISLFESYSEQPSEATPCEAATRELKELGQDPDSWPFNDCRIQARAQMRWTEAGMSLIRRDPFRLDRIQQALSQNPTLPFFLYASERDAFAPIETFIFSVKKLGERVVFRQFVTSGREGYASEDQIWRDCVGSDKK